MSHDWDEFAATWDDTGPAEYADEAAASLRLHARELDVTLAGARVLDFGCGTGLLSERLASEVGHIVALDPSGGMIRQLAVKIEAGLERVEAVEGLLDDATVGLPAFDHPFDLILASSVCAFVPDYPATLDRLARLLRPGGVFVQWDWEWNDADEEPFGLTRDAISQAMGSAGLETVFLDIGFTAEVQGMTLTPLMGIGRKPVI